MTRVWLLVATALTIGAIAQCGSRLATTNVQDERAGLVLSRAGYCQHADAGDLDSVRYAVLYAKSRKVLLNAGEAVPDGGIQCK